MSDGLSEVPWSKQLFERRAYLGIPAVRLLDTLRWEGLPHGDFRVQQPQRVILDRQRRGDAECRLAPPVASAPPLRRWIPGPGVNAKIKFPSVLLEEEAPLPVFQEFGTRTPFFRFNRLFLAHLIHPCTCPRGCLLGAIVERAEPLVARHFRFTIVAFEISVMQLMKKVAYLQSRIVSVAGRNRFIARMRTYCEQHLHLQMEDEVDRMGRKNDMDQNRTEVSDVFDRVHGHA